MTKVTKIKIYVTGYDVSVKYKGENITWTVEGGILNVYDNVYTTGKITVPIGTHRDWTSVKALAFND